MICREYKFEYEVNSVARGSLKKIHIAFAAIELEKITSEYPLVFAVNDT